MKLIGAELRFGIPPFRLLETDLIPINLVFPQVLEVGGPNTRIEAELTLHTTEYGDHTTRIQLPFGPTSLVIVRSLEDAQRFMEKQLASNHLRKCKEELAQLSS